MKGVGKMMGRFMRFITALSLVLGVASGVHAAGSQVRIEPEVVNVAETYFEALRTADLQVLLSLLAGDERAGIETQLSDPAYTDFLIDRYRNARLEIEGSGAKGDYRFVDITIWITEVESFSERLILQRNDDPAGRRMYIVAREALHN
jgi:hypothetical protein